MNEHPAPTPAEADAELASTSGEPLRLLRGSPVNSLAESGAGAALEAARAVAPDVLIDLLTDSGLRGRGGAGFPTGRKWRTVASFGSPVQPTPVVVNAAEGEPGTFKDRALLLENPYLVLEGALIAAHTMGSSEVIVATKASFTHERERLAAAVAEVEAAGWADEVAIRVVDGPSAYLFGEETGLLEVIEGRPPFPRVSPPFRRGVDPAETNTGHSASGAAFAQQSGGRHAPALVDNVETLANVPGIVANGASWFRQLGTETSPGSIVCTVTGSTNVHAVGEFPMGTPLRTVLDTLGGGLGGGRRIAAVLCGASGAPVTPDLLDIRLTYEDFAAAGLGLGSASFIVVDDAVPMARLAASMAHFLAIQSCGQCVPCKRDGLALDAELHEPEWDRAEIESRLTTVNDGARCALAGQTERVVGALVALAEMAPGGEEWDDEVNAIVPLVEIVDGRAVLDVASIEQRPDWSYPEDGPDSGAWPAQHLADEPVTVRPAHTPEPDEAADEAQEDLGADHPFDPLLDAHRALEAHLAALRRAAPGERAASVEQVRHDLDAHRRVTERFLVPMVQRLRPDDGDDLAGYPERHVRDAQRLFDLLSADPASASPRLIDDIAADVHTFIEEVELAILPALHAGLDREHEEELHDGIVAELAR